MADTELYETLGVSRHSSDAEIKRAYHRLARQYHPDKNPGHEEKFKKIQNAYEILSNAEKREMYDRFGMDGIKDDGGPVPGFFGGFGGGSLFSHLFGGDDMFGFHGNRRRRQKAETIGIPLDVTLEELYTGATKSVEYKRKVLCRNCGGSGGKSGSVIRCKKCHGTGIQVAHRPIGPGMVQQIQSTCDDCGGTGDFIKERDRCKKCKGKRTIEVNHKLEVPISQGMKHEQRLPFRGQADELPDGEAGDVIIILHQAEHAAFKRAELDLFLEKKVTLREALCGFSFFVEHLDGRKLLVRCPRGEVISPGCVKGIPEEGMPQFRHPEIKGNLYVHFDVQFPENAFLEEKDLKTLESLLPTQPKDPIDMEEPDVEEVNMIDFESTRGAGPLYKEAYDGDSDDDEPSGHRVGCAHQ